LDGADGAVSNRGNDDASGASIARDGPDSVEPSTRDKNELHSEDEEDERGLLVGRGLGVNTRGEGICTFDERVVRGFLRRNRLRMIIRAHEVTMDGFDLHSE
jgi:hypothetical protein